MYLVIKGKVDLSNYFAIMVLSTLILVSVVVASYFLPYAPTGTALLMAVLSVVSLGSSMRVMSIVMNRSSD